MQAHYAFWPSGLPHSLTVPSTSLWDNLAVNAKRYPDKAALVFFGSQTTYRQLFEAVETLAAQLHALGVAQGDREHVLQVDLVHLLGRTLIDRNQELPAVLHVLQRELGRNRRLDLNVARHQVDFILGQDVVVVDHAAFGTVGDDLLETLGAQLQRAAFGMGAVGKGLGPGCAP